MDDYSFISDPSFVKSLTYLVVLMNTADDFSLYHLLQNQHITDNYNKKCDLYLGQAGNQYPSPLHDLSMYIEHSDKIAMSLVWTCMALLTDSWAC
jgi:hypothetical protein